MPSTYQFNIFADNFQFIVQDENSADDFSTIWSSEALSMQFATGKSAVCPGTLRNVEVSVEIQVLDHEPLVDLGAVDHAVEASFEVPSGTIVVMSCTAYFPDAPRFTVLPGTYRALSIMKGISSIKNEWEPADDSYIVYLWLGEHRQPNLLKHWKVSA